MLGRSKYYKKFVVGEESLLLDLKFAVTEKSETFNPAIDIAILKAILDEHNASLPKGIAMTSNEDSLLVDEIALIIGQMQHDMKVLATWQEKCSNTEANAASALKEFACTQAKRLSDAAAQFVKKHIKFTVWDDENGHNVVLNDLMNWKREIATRACIDLHQVRLVPMLNWCSPSQHTAAAQKNSLAVTQWAITEHQQNVGLLFMPVHTWQRNKLILTESAILTKLQKCNFNLDHQCCLTFCDKSDKRDTRPMTYPMRFLFPATLTDLRNSMWFTSELCDTGRTKPAKQLPAKDMVFVEDLAEDAVPQFQGGPKDYYVSGPQKSEQLGVDAWANIFDGLLTDAELSDTQAIMFIFPNARIGEEVNETS